MFSQLPIVPILEIVATLWQVGRKLWRGLADEGIYEVLEYEGTLDLQSPDGTQAHYHKRQRVRFAQNGVVAYQDQVWGDGDQMVDYQCSPGVEVDRYRLGEKTLVLMSLRDEKKKGDVAEFNLTRTIRDGFLREQESWVIELSHRTRSAKLTITFPKERHPKRIEKRTHLQKQKRMMRDDEIHELSDGRLQVSWVISKPRLNERYMIWWEW